MHQPERLYTEDEVAELLQVAPVTLRKWRGEGRIAFTRLGVSIRYTSEQVLDFIERGCQHPTCADCGEEVVRAG